MFYYRLHIILFYIIFLSSYYIAPENYASEQVHAANLLQNEKPQLFKLTVKNAGGYVLRVKYIKKNDNGTFSVKSKSFSTGKKRNYNIPPYSEIYMHAIAAGGWSKCALVQADGCTVKCARASLNMNCYFTKQNCGQIRGTKEGGCRYAYVTYQHHSKSVDSINVAPGDKGQVILKNSGNTQISHFQVTFLNDNQLPDEKFSTYFHGECLSISALSAGNFCILKYDLPKNENFNLNYHINVTSTSITQHKTLNMKFKTAYVSYFAKENIDKCFIKHDATFMNCHDALNWQDKEKNIGATDFKIQNHVNKTHAYFVHRLKTVYVCDVDKISGNLNHCHNAMKQFEHSNIQIRTIGFSHNKKHVYLSDETKYNYITPKPIIFQCNVNQQTGYFSNCKDSHARVPLKSTNFLRVRRIISNEDDSKVYATYEKNKGAQHGIMICNVSHNSEELCGCQLATSNLHTNHYANYPFDFAFISKDTASVVYLAHRIDICHINIKTGVINHCKNSGADHLTYPIRIILDQKVKHFYFLNASQGKITVCTASSESLVSCKLVKYGTYNSSGLALY